MKINVHRKSRLNSVKQFVLLFGFFLSTAPLLFAGPFSKKAVSYSVTATDAAMPRITVSTTKVRITLNKASGVQLDGSGGTYNISKSGVYDVQPGDYKIYVQGPHISGIRIEAIVEYD